MDSALRPIVNVAAYRFAPLHGLDDLRARLRERCRGLGVRGTILLAPEGINVFMAGTEGEIAAFERIVAEETGLELEYKRSLSSRVPFGRFVIKLKREIIVGDADPLAAPGRRLPARELKRWIEEGREFTLLDTRNDYEIEAGTFKGALTLPLRHFRHFPREAAALPRETREKPVVTFCTGGIRCEKAAPLLETLGFREVYQLEGGILKYFEEVGGDHWEGECFVFDDRVALDPALKARSER